MNDGVDVEDDLRKEMSKVEIVTVILQKRSVSR